MNNEKVVIEVVDDSKGLINIEAAREKAQKLSKMARAIWLAERAAIEKRVKQQRKEAQQVLATTPAYQTLHTMNMEYRKLQEQVANTWFSGRYEKQMEQLFETARTLATTEFKFHSNELYRSWVEDIADVIAKVETKNHIEWNDPQYEQVIEMKLSTTKDWEKKTFDELYKLVSTEPA